MKVSIAVSLLILGIAATVGWKDHAKLVSIRSHHLKLVEDARELGLSTEPSDSPRTNSAQRRNAREDKAVDAKRFAVDFVVFAKEMEQLETNPAPPGDGTQKRILGIMDRLASLDVSQMKIVISELKAATGLREDTKLGVIGFSIMTLGADHPRAALSIITEYPGSFEKNGNGTGPHIISSSLANWAKDDPIGALGWVRENQEKHPEMVTEEVKGSMLSAVATNDPKLAMGLIDELGFKDQGQALSFIFERVKTADGRTAALNALRERATASPEDAELQQQTKDLTVRLAVQSMPEGFDASVKWIEQAKLKPEEMEQLLNSMPGSPVSGDAGKWVDWIAGKLPEEKASGSIRSMVGHWTRADYKAAGLWLAEVPAGPVRNASVSSYAETIAKYNPESAVEWALTLPAGKQKDSTMRVIYQNWPDEDAADKSAAEAFAKQHGIN